MLTGLWASVDLSQVESRLVYVLSKDPEAIRIARLKPYEFDVHTKNAADIFGVSESEVTSAQRMLGKETVHGTQRGERGKKLSEQLLKNLNVVKSPVECDKLIDAYLNKNPFILDYQRDIKREITRWRKLVSPWDQAIEIDFSRERLEDELYRRGYSWKPQHCNAMLLNCWGILVAWKYIKRRGLRSRINLQVHDEVCFSVPVREPQECWELFVLMQRSLEREREYEGVALSVPVTFGLGRTWKKEVEWKRLPSFDELNETIRRLSNG